MPEAERSSGPPFIQRCLGCLRPRAECDWEDPQYEHDYCTGCAMCAGWEGRGYGAIRDQHRREVQQIPQPRRPSHES